MAEKLGVIKVRQHSPLRRFHPDQAIVFVSLGIRVAISGKTTISKEFDVVPAKHVERICVPSKNEAVCLGRVRFNRMQLRFVDRGEMV